MKRSELETCNDVTDDATSTLVRNKKSNDRTQVSSYLLLHNWHDEGGTRNIF